jgi:hypothetical protein
MALPLFLIVVLSGNIDQFLNQQIQASLGSPSGAEKSVYAFGFISLLNGMLFPVFTTLLALAGLPLLSQESPQDFVKKNLNQVMIEMMRAWGKVLQWSLLLILPGFWKYLEYIFVPYVVTLSPDYQNGKEDALKASARLFRRNWGKVIGVFFVFHLFIPLIMASFFDAYRLLWETPISSLFLSLIDTYLILISIQLLFYIFKNEGETHAHVQLERH